MCKAKMLTFVYTKISVLIQNYNYCTKVTNMEDGDE